MTGYRYAPRRRDLAKTEREHERHRAGGPGKAARKGHDEPESSGNKPGQKQAGKEHVPGEGNGEPGRRRTLGKRPSGGGPH